MVRDTRKSPFYYLVLMTNAMFDAMPKPTVHGNVFTAYNRRGRTLTYAESVGRTLTNIVRPFTGRVSVYERIDETINNPLTSLTLPFAWLSPRPIISGFQIGIDSIGTYIIRSLLSGADELRRFWVYAVTQFAQQLDQNPISALPYTAYQTVRYYSPGAIWEHVLYSIGVNVPYRQLLQRRLR